MTRIHRHASVRLGFNSALTRLIAQEDFVAADFKFRVTSRDSAIVQVQTGTKPQKPPVRQADHVIGRVRSKEGVILSMNTKVIGLEVSGSRYRGLSDEESLYTAGS